MLSDAELVRAVLEGERSAYATLVRRYERAAMATATAVLGDRHAAEDAAQEAFLAAYRKLGRLRKAALFGPWLLKIARREALRIASKRRPVQSPDGLDCANPASDGQLDADSQQLLAAVMRLPTHERTVVMLRYFEDCDVAGIASATSRPVGTVTKQLSRARARLREWLGQRQS